MCDRTDQALCHGKWQLLAGTLSCRSPDEASLDELKYKLPTSHSAFLCHSPIRTDISNPPATNRDS
jgi:hypothetical protein